MVSVDPISRGPIEAFFRPHQEGLLRASARPQDGQPPLAFAHDVCGCPLEAMLTPLPELQEGFIMASRGLQLGFKKSSTGCKGKSQTGDPFACGAIKVRKNAVG